PPREGGRTGAAAAVGEIFKEMLRSLVRSDDDPNLNSQVKGHVQAGKRRPAAANLRSCSRPRRVAETRPHDTPQTALTGHSSAGPRDVRVIPISGIPG